MTPRENKLREGLAYAKFKLNEIELQCKNCADLAWKTTEELEKFVHAADKANDVEISKGPQIDPDKIQSIRTVEKSLGCGG